MNFAAGVFQIFGYLYFLALAFLWIKNVRLFLKIKAEEDNRKYSGIFREHRIFSKNLRSIDDFWDYFPLSLLFKRLGFEKKTDNPRILLWLKSKYKCETYFWIISIGGLALIYLSDFIAKGKLQFIINLH